MHCQELHLALFQEYAKALTRALRLCYSRYRSHETSCLAAPPHILLVDDNRDGLLVRRSLLEEVGYGVEIARNGEEGLKLFAGFPLRRGGVGLPHAAHEREGVDPAYPQVNPDARIILLSGFVEPLGLTEENTGADVVLVKS